MTDTLDAEFKAATLAEINKVRSAMGQQQWERFPDGICMFCLRPDLEVGALFKGQLEFIAICRECAVGAQRAFLRGNVTSK